VTQKDLDKLYNDLVSDIEKLFAEIKKMVEQQKIAEEQERLRRIQVSVNCTLVHTAHCHESLSMLWLCRVFSCSAV